MITEEWRSIPSCPGYEASSAGRVRSLDRVIKRGIRSCRATGRILRPAKAKRSMYFHVTLHSVGVGRCTRTIHSLVAEAFAGPRPAGMVVRHLDGDSTNCAASNLVYGTWSQNNHDCVRHGNHPAKSRTHCPRNHRLALPNLRAKEWRIRGYRNCLACSRATNYLRHHRVGDFQQISDRYYAQIMAEVAA